MVLIDLVKPSLYAKMALGFAGTAMFFHMLGLTASEWCHVHIGKVRYSLGLWKGCTQDTENEGVWLCSARLLLVAGSDNRWFVPVRVMLLISVILLIVSGVVLIGYSCLARLERHRLSIALGLAGVLLISATFLAISLIVFATGVHSYPSEWNPTVAWPLGMCLIATILCLATMALVLMDRKLERYAVRKGISDTAVAVAAIAGIDADILEERY